MGLQEIIAEIPKLSFEDRISILEAIIYSLKGDARLQKKQANRGKSAQEMRGILKFPDGHTPDDAEIDELRFQALKEKYLQ